jgi:hypothetical protein
VSHNVTIENTSAYLVPDHWMPFFKALLDLAARIEANVSSGDTPDAALPIGRRIPTCELAKTGLVCPKAATATWWIQHGSNPHDHAVSCDEHVLDLLSLYMSRKRGVFLYPFPAPANV